MAEQNRPSKATLHLTSMEKFLKFKQICKNNGWYIRHVMDFIVDKFFDEYEKGLFKLPIGKKTKKIKTEVN